MSETRVQFNTIISNQLPAYVREDYPLISELLEQYYLGQEYQGGPIDLIQNIDNYIKLDNNANLYESVVLNGDIDFDSTTININPELSPTGTTGFPDSYGLLKIDDEIISYTGTTKFSFTGCIRGFVGITSYRSELNKEEVVFNETDSDDHFDQSTITNLSCLFLKQFLTKIKSQFLPGLEDRNFNSELNQNVFVKQGVDFYRSKGTDYSFEILFRALYNEDVRIVKPRDFLISPSNAQYRIINSLVVEPISGDPENLENATLYQNEYNLGKINKAYAPITSVEKIEVGYGKTFYKLGIDGGYNRDIIVKGAEYGAFVVEPSTRIIGQVSAGSTVLDVDSTVGFGSTGELYYRFSDNSVGVSSYTSKSLTQFYGVTDIDLDIADATVVGVNTFAYGRSKLDQDEIIEVRINSVLSSLNVPSNTKSILKDGKVNVTNFGISEKNVKTNKWFYNVSPTYKVKSIELIDSSNSTYKITLNVSNQFRIGDTAEIILNESRKETRITSITDEKSFTITGQGALNTEAVYTIQRKIQKVSSETFPEAEIYSADIDNVYKNESGDYLISSPSIPHYDSQLDSSSRKIEFSGTFVGDEFKITPGKEHGLYTGDAVYYEAQTIRNEVEEDEIGNITIEITKSTPLFDDGLYFIKRVNDSTVKFAKSRDDIFNSKFISLDSLTTVESSSIKPFEFNGKTLEPQKILRKIPEPLNNGTVTKTEPGLTGIFVNGVELLNYKSKDTIKYGKIESVDVLSEGTDIDVITPPNLIISDSVGTGATGYAAVNGSLKEVRVIDPGFDYLSTPTVKIEGGNGSGAVAQVNMKQIDHEVEFFADLVSDKVTIGTASTQSKIGFTTYHKFRNAEQVLYQTKDQNGVTGIVTNSAYYVSVLDDTTVRLHKNQSDAISGVNTVFLTDYGIGKHSLKSVNKKSIVSSINVINGGSGYENKKRTSSVTGINTATNLITITNHDYKTGEKVKYTCTGTPISGLSVDTEYYVTVVDKDSFHLSQNRTTKEYINMTSVGVGTHIFNYPDITLTLSGNVGISSIGTETFKGSFQPIVRGTVTSIHLENGGVGYGSSEILNLDRQPTIELQSGTDCQLSPIVVGGKIVDIIIQKSGSGYFSAPDLEVIGEGFGAVLVPVLENGSVTDVKIIEPGSDYEDDFGLTTIEVTPAGTTNDLPVFKSNIQTWRVNLFEKYLSYFTLDDGIITSGLNSNKFGLQYSYLYAPRKLRENVFAIDKDGNTLYGEKDLKKVGSKEEDSTKHSPILGFAYDGHPIYGPYGFSNIDGGTVTRMKSGYSLVTRDNRPPTSIFKQGFFVEDYIHEEKTDDTILDENNGRFCVTPDFPKGTYAYFTTIDGQLSKDDIFDSYRRPVFPYVIGNNYKGVPDRFNFNPQSNCDSFDISNDWRRNTQPLNVIEDDIEYSYFYVPNKLNQTATITATSFGNVDNIGIVTGGFEYRVNETLVFNDDDTQGQGVRAKVTRIKGRSVNNISVASSVIQGVEIYPGQAKGEYLLFSDNTHNFEDLDTISISGLSTTSSGLEGFYNAGIGTNTLTIVGAGTTGVAIGNTNVTGIVTYFRVSGDLSYPNIRENDVLIVGSEKIKVLNIDPLNSRIRVLREFDNTVGSTHTIGKFIHEVPRKLTINSGFKTDYSYPLNKQIYFDPAESVALGTVAGVGIGTTISFSNSGAGATSVFVQTKAIYLPGHNLKTGDQITYFTGIGSAKGSGIIVEDETNTGVGNTLADGANLFVAKISDDLIGIATVRVGLGTTGTFVGLENSDSTTLFFRSVGTGDTHSFKTNYDVITGSIRRNLVTVSTAETHGLSSPHNIFVNVSPQNTDTVTLTYNDFNRRLIVNPVEFLDTDVNTTTNAITINSHGFKTGDKVIHTSESPSAGLSDNGVYYVVKVDDNIIKLSNTYYESTLSNPIIVEISSASSGTINPIAPSINLYKNSTVIFDLSDSSLSYTRQGSSYPAFKFNLYVDKNFTKEWEKSKESAAFELSRQGVVGTSGAKAELVVNENTPHELYYNLTPIYESFLPAVKSEIVYDSEVISGNTLLSRESFYNGTHSIKVATATSFTYSVAEIPEQSSYNTTTSLITYDTDCTHTYGPISKIELTSQGSNYYSLPGITTVATVSGTGAILEAKSSSIGSVKSISFDDIGFNLPSDPTLNPRILFPQSIKIDPLASFDSIGVTSFGRGFSIPPRLIVLDGTTGKHVTDVELEYVPGESNVKILKNTGGIHNVQPTIIPVDSGAGVGINTVVFNTADETVTATLSVGFSTINSFPFSVGDKVLVEGIGVGIGSTQTGYNSSDYEYKLFDVTEVTENLGGIGSVTYSMSGLFESGNAPGIFDSVNSSGKILASKYFPTFSSQLVTRDFINGEVVTSDSATGIAQNWDSKITTLTVSSDDNFVVGEVIKGTNSKVQGIASTVTSFDSYVDLGASSEVVQGWQEDYGKLNFGLQKLQDNFYYQNFSYSLRSKVAYDDWNDSVSSLNHTLGYKKFSDYQLETKNDNSMTVGIPTATTGISLVNNIDGFASVNCVYGFDSATENNLTQNSKLISDEIIFSNRILSDYFESVGNRVLSIDDIGGQFNSNPRPTAFSVVDTFSLSDVRSKKYITYIRDKRFTAERQLMIVDVLHDNFRGYVNQYGRVETQYDQGSFDFAIFGSDAQLQFYPTKSTINDYDISVFSYTLKNGFLGIGTTSLGGVATIQTKSSPVTSGVTTTIVSIGDTHTGVKVLVDINPDLTRNDEFESVELNIVHDGTNIQVLEYGKLTTNLHGLSATGLGTYHAYFSGSSLNVDFIPTSVGIATTGVINTIQVGLSSGSITGVGTINLADSKIESKTTNISASGSPGITTVAEYQNNYDCAYFIAQVSDTTNSQTQLSELIVLDDYVSSTDTYETYETEYGTIETGAGLGTFGSRVSAAGTVSLVFTPNENIDTVVNVYMNALTLIEDTSLSNTIDFDNGSIDSNLGSYQGTDSDIKREFELKHEGLQIFERYFEGNNSDIVNVTENSIKIPNHFFVTGEKLRYVHVGTASSAVEIFEDSFVGAANTTFLPGENLFAVKVDDNNIKIATSAANALKVVPEVVDIKTVGIGTSHRFISTNQNAKVVVALDNVIQSPVVSTALTTTLVEQVLTVEDTLKLSGITSFFATDLIKIGDEIMKIEGVGIGSTNAVRVRRGWMGTKIETASVNDLVTKVVGNYNIVDNMLNFVDAPAGNTPIGSTTNSPDERDWTGITTSSSFQGRSFMRSGIVETENETYYKNYIFDDISAGFNATENEFILKQNGSNATGISTENAIILVNDVFQTPGDLQKITLDENSGITTVTFQGTNPDPLGPDVGISKYPKGGIIVSVASTEGFGYQPLVAAGGTAIISDLGSIQSISIGNSGSGYRSGIQTVNVGVGTSSLSSSNIEFIGTAAISGGHIVSVEINNPGVGYTSTNPPFVVFDDPLSYSNIDLEYSSSSTTGFGTHATANIVVGQGSSVIDFEIVNFGYGYGNSQILTVPIGGTTGIPTTSSYSGNEFQVIIDEVYMDKFSGWSLGTLDVLDNVDEFIDGTRKDFPLTKLGAVVSIVAAKGSKINVEDVLLIFVNNILQVPGKAYTFESGGSTFAFTEPPKIGDTITILFYKGSGDNDVIFRNVIETVKKGDTLQLKNDSSVGQSAFFNEDERIVEEVISTSNVKTNPYNGPGNTPDVNFERPIDWCKQTEDVFVNQIAIGKDRELYEPVINSSAYLIKSVGIGSTVVYVDNLRPIFNSQNENEDIDELSFQKKVKFVSKDINKVSAAATAVVSDSGTISSISIIESGSGYDFTPVVTIGNISQSVGLGTTATATATITSGEVTSITLTNAGTGYTTSNPPSVLIEPHTYSQEICDVTSYEGDSGVIVGFGTTTIDGVDEIIVDLHIPYESFLRNTDLVGTAVTLSSISVTDYFTIFNSNVEVDNSSVTTYSIESTPVRIGVSTHFIDTVHQAKRVEVVSRNVGGISTNVLRVNSNVSGIGTVNFSTDTITMDDITITIDSGGGSSSFSGGITTSNYFGEFSWGKVKLGSRKKNNTYSAQTISGIAGISTSDSLMRENSLKFKNYSV